MTVYIDNMYFNGKWCHLVADGENWEKELHLFAASIGMKRNWYQKNHYDCIGSMIEKALAAGAVLLDIKNNHEDRIFLAELRKKHREHEPIEPQ